MNCNITIYMHYAELKAIVRHLKKVMPCNQCTRKFLDEGIRVISTFQLEALFHFRCLNCKNQLIVHVSIVEQGDKTSRLNIQAQNADKISHNDILDIHNFLNKFNGDFKELFSAQ